MLGNEEILIFTVSENSSSAWEEKVAIQQMVQKVPGVAAWDHPAQCPVSEMFYNYENRLRAAVAGPPTSHPVWNGLCAGPFWARTLPQHSQPLPQTPSQHCSCHTLKEQLVKGRSDLPYHEVHVSPLCDPFCLHMERKSWNFCFDLSSSDLIYKCCLVLNTRLNPVNNPFGSSAPWELTQKVMDRPSIWHRCVFFYRRRQNLYREISSLEIQVIAQHTVHPHAC